MDNPSPSLKNELSKRARNVVKSFFFIGYVAGGAGSVISLLLIIGLFLQETGALDSFSSPEITCTTPQDADGVTSFHGQKYELLTLEQLQALEQSCEERNKPLPAGVSEYYSSPKGVSVLLGAIVITDEDCQKVGFYHRKSHYEHYLPVCRDVAIGSSRIKTASFNKFDDSLLIIGPVIWLVYVFTLVVGYLFFGSVSLYPNRQFKLLFCQSD